MQQEWNKNIMGHEYVNRPTSSRQKRLVNEMSMCTWGDSPPHTHSILWVRNEFWGKSTSTRHLIYDVQNTPPSRHPSKVVRMFVSILWLCAPRTTTRHPPPSMRAFRAPLLFCEEKINPSSLLCEITFHIIKITAGVYYAINKRRWSLDW